MWKYYLSVCWPDATRISLNTLTWEEIKNPNNLNRPRTPVEEIYGHIQEGLTTAISLLPDAWDDDNKGRATQWAAIALLGENYLTQGKYAEALAAFKKIEDSGKFSLWQGKDGYSRQFSSDNATAWKPFLMCATTGGDGIRAMLTTCLVVRKPGAEKLHTQAEPWNTASMTGGIHLLPQVP